MSDASMAMDAAIELYSAKVAKAPLKSVKSTPSIPISERKKARLGITKISFTTYIRSRLSRTSRCYGTCYCSKVRDHRCSLRYLRLVFPFFA